MSHRHPLEPVVSPSAVVATTGSAGCSGEEGTANVTTIGTGDPTGVVPTTVPVCGAMAATNNVGTMDIASYLSESSAMDSLGVAPVATTPAANTLPVPSAFLLLGYVMSVTLTTVLSGDPVGASWVTAAMVH